MRSGYNVINVGLLVAGVILIYAGVKGVTPVELFTQLFMDSKANKATPTSPDSSFDKDSPNVGQNRGGGGGGGDGW